MSIESESQVFSAQDNQHSQEPITGEQADAIIGLRLAAATLAGKDVFMAENGKCYQVEAA